MTWSVRLFMLGDGDQFFRLPAVGYARMLRHPSNYPVPIFANQHVRCAEAIVELKSHRVVRVKRMLFWNANFDDHGVLDTAPLGRQSAAAVQATQDETPRTYAVKDVVDEAARLLAKGGSWKPTPTERTELTKIALGEWGCAVLNVKEMADKQTEA
jgi:hypothetical protein